MAFSLIDDDPGAVPLVAVSKAGLAAWRETAPARERDWVAATGFAGDAGKLALVPDKKGRLGRVLVGLGEATGARRRCGPSPGYPTRCRRAATGSRRCRKAPTRPGIALGWALGTYAFTRYRAAKKASGARAGLAGGRRPRRGRAAGRRGVSRPRPGQHPGLGYGPGRTGRRRGRASPKQPARCHRVIVGDALLAENYPTIHAVGRASVRAPRLVDIVWGDAAAPKVTLVGKGVCFDSGGLDLKTASGMLQHEKGHGRRGDHARARPGDHGRRSCRCACACCCRWSRTAVSGNAMRPRDIVKHPQGADRRDRQHRRRRPPDPVRRAGRGLDREPGAAGRHRDLDRRRAGRARPRTAGALLQRRCASLRRLLAAGAAEDDPMWRMPLWRPYRTMLDSKIADLNNVSDGPQGGAITAALYLQEFVEPGIPWAHLDVMAWNNRNPPRPPRRRRGTDPARPLRPHRRKLRVAGENRGAAAARRA